MFLAYTSVQRETLPAGTTTPLASASSLHPLLQPQSLAHVGVSLKVEFKAGATRAKNLHMQFEQTPRLIE